MEMESIDKIEETILPIVQGVTDCKDASMHEIESWTKYNDEYEITKAEIVTLVITTKLKIEIKGQLLNLLEFHGEVETQTVN